MCTAQLIELSPFRSCTGPALFLWETSRAAKQNISTTGLDARPTSDISHTGDGLELNVDSREDTLDLVLREVLSKGPIHQDSDTNGTLSYTDVTTHAVLRVRSAPIAGIEELVEANWDHRWRPVSRHHTNKGQQVDQHEQNHAQLQDVLQLDRPVPYKSLFAKAVVQGEEALVSTPPAPNAKTMFLGSIAAITMLGGAASAGVEDSAGSASAGAASADTASGGAAAS